MRRYLILFLVVFSFAFYCKAENLSALFETANNYYINKQYEKALTEYKKIETELKKAHKYSFKLYYNLGCTYFRLNDLANSRYYFEKARRIKPLDRDLNKNLKLILTKLKDKEKTVEPGIFLKIYKKLYQSVSLNSLTVFLIFVLLFVFFIIGLLISSRYDKKRLYYALGVGLFLLVFSFSLFYSRYNFTFQKEGIVFSDEIDVFSEPNTSSTILFKLHKATKVKIENQLNGYAHISLPDGLNGWVDRQYIKEI